VTFARIKVVINPAAGKNEAILGTLNDVFGPAGIKWDVSVTNQAGDAERLAGEASTEDYDLVAACGGDGTVGAVATALAGSGTPMAILPEGTANVMASELGIPADLAGAARLIAEGHSTLLDVDMGEAAGTRFLLRAGVGFEAAMANNASPGIKRDSGLLAYALSGFQALMNPVMAEYRIEIDGRHFKTTGLTCIVANSGSVGIGDIRLAPGCDVSDGLLDVIVVGMASLPALVGTAGQMVGGQDAEAVQHWQGRRIRVESTPVEDVILDGERAGTTPIEANILPAAIRVVVPQ
jgi:diacylglycerol kinase (ATP)